jgi:hypothetical protein
MCLMGIARAQAGLTGHFQGGSISFSFQSFPFLLGL